MIKTISALALPLVLSLAIAGSATAQAAQPISPYQGTFVSLGKYTRAGFTDLIVTSPGGTTTVQSHSATGFLTGVKPFLNNPNPVLGVPCSVPCPAIPKTEVDFNGDGLSDTVWVNPALSGGNLYQYNFPRVVENANGVGFGTTLPFPPYEVPGEFTIRAFADFNGDGKTDILWRNGFDGTNYVWIMDGSLRVDQYQIPTVAPGWSPVAAGDTSGDNKADIFWRKDDGTQSALWVMNGAAIANQAFIPVLGSAENLFFRQPSGAFLFQRETNGTTKITQFQGTSVLGSNPGPTVASNLGWNPLKAFDVNADGFQEIVWHKPSTKELATWKFSGTQYTGGIW